ACAGLVGEMNELRRLVVQTVQLAGGDGDHPCSWVVGAHVRGEDRLVPARPGREEVDERHPKLVSSPKCTVVGLVDGRRLGTHREIRRPLLRPHTACWRKSGSTARPAR